MPATKRVLSLRRLGTTMPRGATATPGDWAIGTAGARTRAHLFDGDRVGRRVVANGGAPNFQAVERIDTSIQPVESPGEVVRRPNPPTAPPPGGWFLRDRRRPGWAASTGDLAHGPVFAQPWTVPWSRCCGIRTCRDPLGRADFISRRARGGEWPACRDLRRPRWKWGKVAAGSRVWPRHGATPKASL